MPTSMARTGQTTEVSFECSPEEVAVLDGYVQATGISRTKVMREILAAWSEKKLHEAVSICRVTGVNPHRPVPVRGDE